MHVQLRSMSCSAQGRLSQAMPAEEPMGSSYSAPATAQLRGLALSNSAATRSHVNILSAWQ